MLSKEEIGQYKKLIDSKEYEANIVEKNLIKYIKQLETNNKKLIKKLEKDIANITRRMQDGKHCDDYSRCRLKAYRTKTKEILKILKGEK